MKSIIGLGRYIFIIPALVFGIMHLIKADEMAGMVPFGGVIMIYISGVCLILASISIIIGKYDKLAAVLLAVLLLIIVLTVHVPGLGDEATLQLSMSNVLKDLGLMGGALMVASMAKDKSIIG